MNNDPLANALSKIMNYEKLGREAVELYPVGSTELRVLQILHENSFLGQPEQRSTTRGTVAKVPLLGKVNVVGVIKPRFAAQKTEFEKFEKRFLPAKGFGIIIISTAKGMMTLDEAKKEGIGGRLIAYCY